MARVIRSKGEAARGKEWQEHARAPFPYFGGKTHCSGLIWSALGDCKVYVEPFAGSLGCLLQRPHWPFEDSKRLEIVNDLDGMIANFWRAMRDDPDLVASHCDHIITQQDLQARHYWLVTEGRARVARIIGDPDAYDAKVAGWWAWGLSAWFGSGFCSGDGPWCWDGSEWVNRKADGGVRNTRPHVGDFGQGVHAQRPNVGNFGQGVHAQRPHVSDFGQGEHLLPWFRWLSARLRGVRVLAVDYEKCLRDSICKPRLGSVGVFLDPPYADTAKRDANLYTHDSLSIAHDVMQHAIRIADLGARVVVAGLDTEHEIPDGWAVHPWRFKPGQGNTATGYGREVLIMSPTCLPIEAECATSLLC